MVNKSPGISGSMAEIAGVMERELEKFNAIAKLRWRATPDATHITPDWKVVLEAAESLGVGTQKYELVDIDFGYPPKSLKEMFEAYDKQQQS